MIFKITKMSFIITKNREKLTTDPGKVLFSIEQLQQCKISEMEKCFSNFSLIFLFVYFILLFSSKNKTFKCEYYANGVLKCNLLTQILRLKASNKEST